MNSITSPETSGTPIVDVRYGKGMNFQNSLLQIDGQALGNALVKIGYAPSTLKPLVIEDDPNSFVIGKYDPLTKTVNLNQRTLINSIKGFYSQVLHYIDEIPSDKTGEKQDLFAKISQSSWFKNISPPYWPYAMLKNKGIVQFWTGNNERRSNYLNAAKAGTLEPDKTIEEQRARAAAHMGTLIELASKRFTGWTMAHEYEHVNKSGKKIAIKYGLGLAPIIAGLTVLEPITSSIPQSSQGDATYIGVFASLGLGLYGFIKGRSIEEAASYEAGYKNVNKLMSCFKINPEVFEKEILRKDLNISHTNSMV